MKDFRLLLLNIIRISSQLAVTSLFSPGSCSELNGRKSFVGAFLQLQTIKESAMSDLLSDYKVLPNR